MASITSSSIPLLSETSYEADVPITWRGVEGHYTGDITGSGKPDGKGVLVWGDLGIIDSHWKSGKIDLEKNPVLVREGTAFNIVRSQPVTSFRTGDLCLKAMDLSSKILSINGIFLSKIFMGSVFSEINKKANKLFSKVVKYKPISSKSESKEIYIFCKGILKM